MINDKLFESQDFILSAIDFDKDPEIDSGYTLNLRYARYWCGSFIKPLSKNEIKKKYEKVEKKMADSHMIHFAIRTKMDQHLIGFVRMGLIWNHSVGWLDVGIGDSNYYGIAERQIIPLVLRFAFYELNLFRIEIDIPEFESKIGKILEENGFLQEAENRGAIYYDLRFWNEYLYGILRPEWEALNEVKE